MKRISFLVVFSILSLSFISSGNTVAQENNTDWNYLIEHANWDSFSKNLVMGLKSGNTGVQVSAMRLVIKYKDYVNVDRAVIDLVGLYRNHKDDRVRQMALVTIHAIRNNWAIGVIKRDLRFENNEKIKRMMLAILADVQRQELAAKEKVLATANK